jgi:hypothetical protein
MKEDDRKCVEQIKKAVEITLGPRPCYPNFGDGAMSRPLSEVCEKSFFPKKPLCYRTDSVAGLWTEPIPFARGQEEIRSTQHIFICWNEDISHCQLEGPHLKGRSWQPYIHFHCCPTSRHNCPNVTCR